MKLKIINTAHHRNGVGGAPFDVVLFKDRGSQGSRKVAILFEEPAHCAVLDIAKLYAGDIAFGSNSWRGDDFEAPLRHATKKHWQEFVPSLRKRKYEEAATPTNASRALAFEIALDHHSDFSDDDPATRCIDLLADARHWCDLNGHSFADLDRQAYQHYLAERHDQPTEERGKP